MWAQYTLFAVTLLPGLVGIAQLRPYEYAYFNSFVGGVRGAADDYALEYWCTSYREAMAYVNQVARRRDTVLVFLAPDNAAPVRPQGISWSRTRNGDLEDVQYVLTCTYALGDDWSAIPMVGSTPSAGKAYPSPRCSRCWVSRPPSLPIQSARLLPAGVVLAVALFPPCSLERLSFLQDPTKGLLTRGTAGMPAVLNLIATIHAVRASRRWCDLRSHPAAAIRDDTIPAGSEVE